MYLHLCSLEWVVLSLQIDTPLVMILQSWKVEDTFVWGQDWSEKFCFVDLLQKESATEYL